MNMQQETAKSTAICSSISTNTLMDFTAGERAALYQTMEEEGFLLSERDYRRLSRDQPQRVDEV